MATSKRAWQQLEQWWAMLHGEERSGPTGRDLPDCTLTNTTIALEVKFQERRTLRSEDINQARSNAQKVGLPWALILHEKNHERTEDLVVLPVATYLGLLTGRLTLLHIPTYTKELAEYLLPRRSA